MLFFNFESTVHRAMGIASRDFDGRLLHNFYFVNHAEGFRRLGDVKNSHQMIYIILFTGSKCHNIHGHRPLKWIIITSHNSINAVVIIK